VDSDTSKQVSLSILLFFIIRNYMIPKSIIHSIIFILSVTFFSLPVRSQGLKENPALDERVKKILDKHSGHWYDMNVPVIDGNLLYDIIIKNNYKSALEIGTSTGHSGIWIAWALSKTGGKLITIEIDQDRYKTAIKNFEEAGLLEYIDARLADAHKLVPELKGPFDFVFSDADKDWYKNYFIAVDPKLKTGGSYISHNVFSRVKGSGSSSSYADYLLGLKNYKTTFNDLGNGVSISYKKSDN
jgi:caffeoyl-CoA O-methyltransferase